GGVLRVGGGRLCWNKQWRTDAREAAVWEDVRRLLPEPERIRAEYERRRRGREADPGHEVGHLQKMIANVKRLISRLIDAYGEGLVEKSEVEARIAPARRGVVEVEGGGHERLGRAAEAAGL